MCRPEHFTVSYTINPWMEPANPTDTAVALRQWQDLYDTYISLGHEIELIDPIEGLPDMVYTANGGFLIDGVAYGPKFRFQERAGEAVPFIEWFRAAGFDTREPVEVNEGEGDFLLVGDVVLAGTGFRSTGDSHREIGEVFGREVISLTLTDPRFYHLDTALAVLDPVEGVANGGPERANIAYLPSAFDARSQAILAERYPDAIHVSDEDGAVFGLNSASDGLQRHHLAAREGLREAAARARLQPDPRRPVRAPARRRRHQVLHPGAARSACHDHAADARRQHVGASSPPKNSTSRTTTTRCPSSSRRARGRGSPTSRASGTSTCSPRTPRSISATGTPRSSPPRRSSSAA